MVAHGHVVKGSVSNISISHTRFQAYYFKDTLSFLKQNQSFLIGFSLNVVVSSINKFIDYNWNLFLIDLDLLVVVLVERVTLL